ncbi:M4 family metallopeptidase [Staphylococcus intermedius]|uniref:Neutral metalloproteinase n=1 Tax=Staphylococcus intermedius NCTC 11048 TaxID=1141106 RepID=A0A380G5S3_STAIN|nr:M4 family metallopeptidase [Staphylococcus intermedius]PCF63897.1 aureolysin [Staphylococcus intermedius]PCF78612.1 aureolysin [Staphylococcus intermedius]PCF79585.1 aureolysin [Staphylococcus intermedius]PCF86680.1 aureolysin [Staphylococcus intermedius]PCF89757.1 aureolysin [Staphylococcus intermedius]
MFKLSKRVLFGTLCLSVLAVSPNVYAESSDTPLEKNFKTIVKEKSDANKALKELPSDVKDNYKDYDVVNTLTDDLGYTHYTLQPVVDGIHAKDQEVKVHVDKSGKVVLINGAIKAEKVDPTNRVSLSKEDALSTAFKAVNMKQSEASNLDEDVVKVNDVEIDGEENKYIYHLELVTMEPDVTHWDLKIDAETGDVVEKTDLVAHAAAKGTGLSVLGEKKRININSIDGGYALEDVTSSAVMAAYTFQPATGSAELMTDEDTEFTDEDQSAGVDANDYAKKVYDYYLSKFNRHSYDNKDSDIMSIVHVNNYQGEDNRNNAAWIGDKMIYGDGDGTTFTSLAGADDVVAHEITHGVTQETAGLVYQGQPGALNESMSDVFAYFIDPEDALIGEDVYTPGRPGDALRSMSNPEDFNQPGHMDDYVNTTSDHGGVHTNSGIPNKAAYLTVDKIGQEQAEQIYYRALTTYLASNSNFADAKASLVQSAFDLYGEDVASQVESAWDEVGV